MFISESYELSCTQQYCKITFLEHSWDALDKDTFYLLDYSNYEFRSNWIYGGKTFMLVGGAHAPGYP